MKNGIGGEEAGGAGDASARVGPSRGEKQARHRRRVPGAGGERPQGEELVEALLAMVDVPFAQPVPLLEIHRSQHLCRDDALLQSGSVA